MRLSDFIAMMDRIAPPELAMSFDNAGLLVGPDHEEIHRVLVALDVNVDTVREAVEWKADLMLTHHPQMFHAVRQILPDDPETAVIYRLVHHGIGHFAAHTNLDCAPGGVNDVLCGLFGLENVTIEPAEGCTRVGTLPEAVSLSDFAQLVQSKLGDNVRYVGDPEQKVKRIAVCGGAGDSEIPFLRGLNADAFLTGEVKHSTALSMRVLGIGLVTAGHFETEHPVLEPLISRLQRESNDVQYNLARSETSPFRCR